MRNGASLLTIALLIFTRLPPVSSQDFPAIPLGVREIVPVEQDFGVLIVQVPIKCDARGNVYFRKYQRDFDASPVVRVSRDGKQRADFSIRKAPGFEKGRTDDVAVGLTGEVYILGANAVGKLHIVTFSRDGSYDSSFELAPVLDANHFAVFPSGEFLIAGEELSEKDRKPTGKPLLALYDRRGRFVHEISLPRDVEEVTVADEAGKGYEFSLTHVGPAEDGNIYLMRRIAAPTVYVISPAGAVLRRLVIPPPAEDFEPLTMKVGGGKVVVQFEKKTPEGPTAEEIFSVFDALTGEKFADYSSTPEVGGAWACYTADGFTFLGIAKTQPYQMTLVRAVPR
jgi:hypothetical protein